MPIPLACSEPYFIKPKHVPRWHLCLKVCIESDSVIGNQLNCYVFDRKEKINQLNCYVFDFTGKKRSKNYFEDDSTDDEEELLEKKSLRFVHRNFYQALTEMLTRFRDVE